MGQFESQSHRNDKTLCSFDESRGYAPNVPGFSVFREFPSMVAGYTFFCNNFFLFYLLKDCSGCILYSFIAYFAGTFLFFRIFDVCSLVLFVIVISSIFYKNERCHVYRVLLSTSSKPCLSNKVIYILDVPEQLYHLFL